ncbi:MAG: HAD family hydrolase [Candidatus Saccharimonas sp.]|nr:HAD family hydrolase [Planctomycetaceae bacterium]
MTSEPTTDRRALHGMIFDLDGTHVDSGLDFDAIRRDMGLPDGMPILESLDRIPAGSEKDRMLEVLRQHELTGAARATLYDGVHEFLEWLDQRGISRAVLTRNSRESTRIVLDRLGLHFELALTREDAPPKPDPTGLLTICGVWQMQPAHVLFCGDYVFDLEAGSRAGMESMLFAPRELPDFARQADHVLRSFHNASALIDRHFVTARPS